MKVILTKDVPHLGQAHALKDVADGYARNYLLPRGLAVLATRAARQALAGRLAQAALQQKAMLAEAANLIKKLKGVVVTLTGQAEKDTLFGSFGPAEIAAALAPLGLTVPVSAIKLPKPLKKVGEHGVAIEFSPKLATTLTVRVTALGQAAAETKTKPKAPSSGVKVKSRAARVKKAKISQA